MLHSMPSSWFSFFANSFQKNHETQKEFLEDLMFFVIKRCMPLRNVESIWLHQLAYVLCHRVVFPFWWVFVEEVLHFLISKTLSDCVQHALNGCLLTTCIFDLWVLKGVHDMFIFVVNFCPILRAQTCLYWDVWSNQYI